MARRHARRAAWPGALALGLVLGGCATTFPCGKDARCEVATEYCSVFTPGAIGPEGAPSPVQSCQRFEPEQPHRCPDFSPASGCGCSQDFWSGGITMGCNAP